MFGLLFGMVFSGIFFRGGVFMTDATDNVYRINQRRKKRGKKRKRNLLIKSVLVAILIYFVLAILFSFHSSMSTTIALNGNVTEEFVADGYIFREQSIINSPATGNLEAWVDEGERVSKDQVICNVYTGEYSVEQSQKIRALNQEIARLKLNVEDQTTFKGNSVMVEQRISSTIRNLTDLKQNRDMSKIAEVKEDLNTLFDKKAVINAGGTIDKEAEIKALEEELINLEAGIGGAKFEIKAPLAGVFSSGIDGLEDKLTFSAVQNVTPGYLTELKQSSIKKDDSIVQNEPVCKIINNYEWYFATIVDAEKAENLAVGKKIKMRFFDFSDSIINGTIVAISGEENGKVAISVKTNKYVDGIYSSSIASAEIITASAEGIKLPAKSLHVVDEQTGVYVIRLGVLRFVPVNVIYRNADWIVVSPNMSVGAEYNLQIYDEVVVDAKNLEDGKVVR